MSNFNSNERVGDLKFVKAESLFTKLRNLQLVKCC